MATSLQDLVDQARRLTALPGTDAAQAGDAIAALGHAGPALSAVADGLFDAGLAADTRRVLAMRELAAACTAASRQWPRGSGRLADVVGVAADLLAARTTRLEVAELWSAGIAISGVVRRCADRATAFPPYARVPALVRVRRTVALVDQVAALDPPDPRRRAALDALLPPTELSPNASTARQVADSVAGLVQALDRGTRTGALHLADALAVSTVAELAARHGVTLAAALTGTAQANPAWTKAPAGWRTMQAALTRFEDGSRYRTDPASAVARWEVQLHSALQQPAPPGKQADLAELATTTRLLVNHLPLIARHLERAVERWARDGALLAAARSLPRSDEHINAVMRNQVVVVTARDVGPVLLAARAARCLSTALATELDRSAGLLGDQPQPHLARALAAESRTPRVERDARWAHHLAARYDAVTAAAPHLSR
jgi:hypothetical protein